MKLIAGFLSIVLTMFIFCGCSTKQATLVGISMPNKTTIRWENDANYLRTNLESYGYNTQIAFAGNDSQMQISQIEAMINNGAKLIIVTAVDSSKIQPALEIANDNDVKIVAYDRLISDSDSVSAFATFDGYRVGVLQAEFIVKKLELEKRTSPANVMFIAHKMTDSNTKLFYNGAMSILSPYLKDGSIKATNDLSDLVEIVIPSNMPEDIESSLRKRFKDIGDTAIDAILSPTDNITRAAISILNNKTPIITGQDADRDIVDFVAKSDNMMTVYKDNRKLTQLTADVANNLLSSVTPETNTSINNGVIDVPLFVCDVVAIDQNNYAEVLFDSGIYQY